MAAQTDYHMFNPPELSAPFDCCPGCECRGPYFVGMRQLVMAGPVGEEGAGVLRGSIKSLIAQHGHEGPVSLEFTRKAATNMVGLLKMVGGQGVPPHPSGSPCPGGCLCGAGSAAKLAKVFNDAARGVFPSGATTAAAAAAEAAFSARFGCPGAAGSAPHIEAAGGWRLWVAKQMGGGHHQMPVEDLRPSDLEKGASCGGCGRGGATLRCGRCKSVRYCDRRCQAFDWKRGHKATCRVPAAAAAGNVDDDSASPAALEVLSSSHPGDPRRGGNLMEDLIMYDFQNPHEDEADGDHPLQLD